LVADDFSRFIPHMEKSKSVEVKVHIEVHSTLEKVLPIPIVNSSLEGNSDKEFYLVTTHSDNDHYINTVVSAAPFIDKPSPREEFELISAVPNSVVGQMGVVNCQTLKDTSS